MNTGEYLGTGTETYRTGAACFEDYYWVTGSLHRHADGESVVFTLPRRVWYEKGYVTLGPGDGRSGLGLAIELVPGTLWHATR